MLLTLHAFNEFGIRNLLCASHIYPVTLKFSARAVLQLQLSTLKVPYLRKGVNCCWVRGFSPGI